MELISTKLGKTVVIGLAQLDLNNYVKNRKITKIIGLNKLNGVKSASIVTALEVADLSRTGEDDLVERPKERP